MADVYASNATLLDRQRRHAAESARRLADSHRDSASQRAALCHQWPPEQNSSQGVVSRGSARKARERQAVRWLATGEGQFDDNTRSRTWRAESRPRKRIRCRNHFRRGYQRRRSSRSRQLRLETARPHALHGARRLREFARRRRHGHSARPASRLRAALRRRRTRPIQQTLGRRNSVSAGHDGSRDDGSGGRGKTESSLRRRRKSREDIST